MEEDRGRPATSVLRTLMAPGAPGPLFGNLRPISRVLLQICAIADGRKSGSSQLGLHVVLLSDTRMEP